MKVIIDDKEIEVEHNITVIHDDQIYLDGDGDEQDCETHLILTDEGLVVDIVDHNKGEVVASSWHMVSDLMEQCH